VAELQRLLAQCGEGSLTPIHWTAAVSCLAQLPGRRPPKQQLALQCMQRLQPLLPECQGREVSSLLLSLARLHPASDLGDPSLQQQLPWQLLLEVLDRAADLGGSMTPQQLSVSIWAASQLGVCSAAFSGAMQAAAAQQLPRFEAQHLANVAAGAASLAWDGSGDLVAALLRRAAEQIRGEPVGRPGAASEADGRPAAAASEAAAPAAGAAPEAAGAGSQEAASAQGPQGAAAGAAAGVMGVAAAAAPPAAPPAAAGQPAALHAGFTMQGLTCLCWAAAVARLPMRADARGSLLPHVRTVCAAVEARQAAGAGGGVVATGKQQLFQLGIWLSQQGMEASDLVGRQLYDACEQAWRRQLAATQRRGGSGAAREVAALLQQEAGSWGVRDVQVEAPAGPQGLLSIDIAATATSSSGRAQALALEVDGGHHYVRWLQPGGRPPTLAPTGETAFRDVMLGAWGYVVVCVPVHEWGACGGERAAQAELLRGLVLRGQRRRSC
jgi:hypothetical protein